MDIYQIVSAIPPESDLAKLIPPENPRTSRTIRYCRLLEGIFVSLISTRIVVSIYAGEGFKILDCTFRRAFFSGWTLDQKS